MKFAIAKEIITPKEPVFMAGFGSRTHKSTGVHDDIYVKTVLLKSNQPLLILAMDVIGGDRSFEHGIKEELFKRFGLKRDEILINYSHTHGAVYMTGEDPVLRKGKTSMGKEEKDPLKLDFTVDVAYYHMVKDKILGLVESCYEQLEEGTLHVGLGKTDISVSRRRMTPEGLKWAPNFDAEIDKDLFVLKLTDDKGELRGVVFSHGCHPTSMNNYEISAEFVGHACRKLEDHYEGVEAVFLQACGAEIKPAKSASGDGFKLCNFDEMMEIGDDFAQDVIRVMEEESFRAITPSFQSKLIDITLYFQKYDITVYQEKLKNPETPEIMRPIYEKLVKTMAEGKEIDRLPFYIAIWHLDEETRLIALESEVSTEYALKIKQLFDPEKTIVLGYSNVVFTYIATRSMLKEGGYEVDRSPLSNGFTGPFAEEVEDIIIGRIVSEEIL